MIPQALLAMLVSPPIAVETVRSFDLGKLAFRDAEHFNGQPVGVSFVVDSLPDVIDGETLVDAEGNAGAWRSVRFGRGIQAGQRPVRRRSSLPRKPRT
jgi:hypothetical protein